MRAIPYTTEAEREAALATKTDDETVVDHRNADGTDELRFTTAEPMPASLLRAELDARLAVIETQLEIVPAWAQPFGAHDAYAAGATVTHNGQTWTSDVDANVWEPAVFRRTT